MLPNLMERTCLRLVGLHQQGSHMIIIIINMASAWLLALFEVHLGYSRPADMY